MALHDVAPPFEAEIRDQLERLDAIGVRRRVLKVVPNWHGMAPLVDAPSLVELLAAEQAAGNQIVLHGLEHRPRGELHGSPLDRLRGAIFARDAAEFLTLSPLEAGRAVIQGLDVLEGVGLGRPDTFCPPGWLLPRDAYDAVAQAGIRYLLTMLAVHDLSRGRSRRLPAIGFMGTGGAQEAGVGILNTLVRQTVLGTAGVATVYLHPQGWQRSLQARRTVDDLARMVDAEGWIPVTYAACR